MRYQLLKYNKNKLIDKIQLDIPYYVIDFAIKNEKMYYLTGNMCNIININTLEDILLIGKYNENKEINGDISSIQIRFNKPSSILYNEKNSNIYIVENNGKQIRIINNDNIGSLIKGSEYNKLLKYFINIPLNTYMNTSLAINHNKIYWISTIINRCFFYANSQVYLYMGNGHAGNGISNKLIDNEMYNPQGICINNNITYINDTGNKILKKIEKNKMQFLFNNFENNTKIIDVNNNIYIKDNNNIKYFDIYKLKMKTLQFNNLIGLTKNNNFLYILEKD